MISKPINRRTALKGIGSMVGAPVVIPSSVLGNEKRAPANDRITVAGVGMGGRGRSDIHSFAQFREVQVVASCDVYRSRREQLVREMNQLYEGDVCRPYLDYREVCAREDIDVVFCGTPDHWHALVTIEACKNGKDVYCEKPLSLTVAEGRAMVDAARRYARVVSSGSQRVLGDYGRLARTVRSGIAGPISECWVDVGGPPQSCDLPGEPVPDDLDWEMWLGPAPWAAYHPYRCGAAYGLSGKGWRTWRDYSGGVMTDWGGHKFGGAMFALGKEHEGPVEVLHPSDAEVPRLTCVFADGLKMYVGGNPRGEVLTFKGANGQVPGLRESGPVDMPGYKGRGGIIGDFLHCVKTREKPFRDVEIAHRTATVCHLGNIAFELGRSLKWDPKAEACLSDSEANRLLSRPMRWPWTI